MLLTNNVSPIKFLCEITEVDKILWETTYKDNVIRTPIHKRVKKEKINRLLQLQIQINDKTVASGSASRGSFLIDTDAFMGHNPWDG